MAVHFIVRKILFVVLSFLFLILIFILLLAIVSIGTNEARIVQPLFENVIIRVFVNLKWRFYIVLLLFLFHDWFSVNYDLLGNWVFFSKNVLLFFPFLPIILLWSQQDISIKGLWKLNGCSHFLP